MDRGKRVRIGVAIALTVAYAWLAVHVVDLGAMHAAMQTASVSDLELGAACFFLMLLIRAMRLAVFIGRPRSVAVWLIAVVHSALNALLPAKLGELSLPIFLRRFIGMSGYSGMTVLVLLRLHDLLAMCVVGGVLASTFLQGSARLVAIAGVAIALVGQVVLVVSGPGIMRACMMSLPLRWRRWRVLRKLQDAFRAVDRTASFGAAVLSLCLWVMLALALGFFSTAVHASMPMGLLGLAMIASSLAFAIPAGGLANVGPFEAAWSWVLHVAGWAIPDAVSSALFVHGCALLGSIVAGLLCVMGLVVMYNGRDAKQRSHVQ